jgi:DNA-binding transcriptional LysR family regulator
MEKASQIIHPHKLMVFAKVAEIGNITHAAQLLHMTQPAVTNIIRQLEKHYQQKLISHQGKKILITDAGKVIASYWQAFETLFDDLNDRLSAHQKGDRGEIKLAMVSTAKYFMPSLISRFKETYPLSEFKCHITNRHEIIDDILECKYDLAIITNPDKHLEITEHHLSKNKLVFVCKAHHQLLKQKKITFKDIANQTFITRERSALITQTLYDYFNHFDKKPQVAYEIDSTEAIKEAVATSNSLALLPLISINRAIKSKDLNVLPIDIPAKFSINSWYIIHKQSTSLNAISKKFQAFVMSELSAL